LSNHQKTSNATSLTTTTNDFFATKNKMESKPLIIVIDDDREVLGTLASDLRHQYGGSFQVLPSSSARKTLESLPQLKLRQNPVALFLVDQRMPDMTGVEFLEEAMKIFQNAKRVLITAYAETSAAIKAINKAKVDYYLTKPWFPPEGHLYPVLNDLLEVWQAPSSKPFHGIEVVGCRWSPKTHQIKDFLARHQVSYQWRDIEKDRQARQLTASTCSNATQLPLLLFPDGSQIASPSTKEIAQKIGLKSSAQMPFYDLIIVGGGPAGLAAAVYGASEGLNTVLLEREAPGGQAGTSSRIENYLGFPGGLTGDDLARRAVAQAYKFGTEILVPQEVSKIRVEGQYRLVTLADGTELSCHALLVATGVSYTKLNVPGIERLKGAGVYYGAAKSEAVSCIGDDIYIIGGANSAGQAAMYLSQFARSVTLIVRADSLAKKMSKYLLDQIQETKNIVVKLSTQVIEVLGKEKLETLTLSNLKTGAMEIVRASALFTFIGAKPNTSWLKGAIECDDQGFIITGPNAIHRQKESKKWKLEREPFLFETSEPGIFAVGDVRCQSVKRVASAVGEGSVAIQFVHQYLSHF
jgi:thioredoxin reductase (NADPH)